VDRKSDNIGKADSPNEDIHLPWGQEKSHGRLDTQQYTEDEVRAAQISLRHEVMRNFMNTTATQFP